MTPTYDQLLKDIKAAGVNFSDYDLAFARENPTAGYGILNAKKDYAAATTDEARALANSAAEQWRAQGGYSAGVSGSGYNPLLPQSTGNNMLDSKTSQLVSFPSYQYDLPSPTWDDSYGAKYDAALNSMLDYAPFSYDYKTDPLYASYKKSYTREGQRATADALGQAAAATGGIPSSFAATAAAQAGNYYAAQLADKIPELYQLAYNQYADQYNRLSNNVGALQNARSFDFGTYQTALNQYNADRNFDYGVYSDNFNRLASQIGVLTDQDNTAYAREQAALKAAGRGGNPTPEEEPTATMDTNAFNMLLSQLRSLGNTQEALNLLRQYSGSMTTSQKNLAYRTIGIDPKTVASGVSDAYLDLLAPTLPSAQTDAAAVNTNTPQEDYEYAVKVLNQYGYNTKAANMLTPEMWRQDGRSQYDNYGDYARAYVAAHLK